MNSTFNHQSIILNKKNNTKERELEIQEINAEQFAIGVAATVDNRIRGANIHFKSDFR